MFLNKFLLGLGLGLGLGGTVLTIAPQAQAATLTGFTFGTQVTGTNPKKDIRLDSVTIGTTTINQFELVKRANVVTNTMFKFKTGEFGPASTDYGDETTTDSFLPQGPKVEQLLMNDVASNAAVVASLGNLNMNSIIDTENDFGTAVIDVFFDPKKLMNTFFFFERGGLANQPGIYGDSDLLVQGLDIAGNVIGTAFKIDRSQWTNAGYKIDTTEVITGGAQKVGSYGLTTATAGFSGLRLTSMIGFNGPDFKVVASKVPEPASLLGLGLVGGMAALTRRRRATTIAD
jgi:hypothetical protein